ncbi:MULTISPECIES: SDR family NAD(P)-dependent oxidoreductase [Haloferax]|uniref:SDR family NAD(P)-dependent oxidoreductase n=1 Tax=Haloferax marinum TaxID=2666143 RepID=A0A6A8GAC1_9EURY|nr:MULTISPECIES: SDR family oxidoreductase [Haloferax]KAB1198556.1 SDR family oxidoreductase [Haloferax sp. CBA1150]MRW97665.1 SDR family NAD(P)-dependent oxidoreductase [Haloferax marinum]
MNDTTVVVTGASSGIGAAVARAFGHAGATVVVCARDTDALQTVVDDVETAGGSATAIRGDVRDEFDMERLMETAARVGGPIDVLVANAGVNHGTPGEMPMADETYAAFDDTLRTNVRGVFAAVKEALPHMADDARILVPSGSIAREAKPGMGAYAVSKAASEALVRQFAADCSQTVGVIDPGLVATDVTGGQGRDPDDVAQLFVWAATEAEPTDLDGAVLGLSAWKQATR